MMPAVSSDTEETRLGRFLDLRLMLRFLGYARPYRRWIGLAFLLLPVTTALQTAQPLVIKGAVDGPMRSGDMGEMGLLLAILGALVVLQFVTGYLQNTLNAAIGQSIVRDLRRELFAHLLRQEAAYFDASSSGRITNRVSNDTEAVSQMVSAGVINLMGDFLLMAAIAGSMFWLSPPLFLIALPAAPVVAWVTVRTAQKLRMIHRQGRLLQSRMAGRLTEECEGNQVVRIFRRQKENLDAFDRLNQEYHASAVRANWLETFQMSFVETASTLIVALLFWYGGGLSSGDAVTIGTLVAFIDYIRRLFLPLRDLSAKFTTMQAAMTALERIFHLLDREPAIHSPAPGIVPAGPLGIRFEGARFSYGKEEVLKGVNLTIAPGERVAVVGPTGAGKSTLIKLLNRFHDVTAGRVTLGGVDVRQIPLERLRQLVGVVRQENFLFAGTVAENVGLWDPAISRERIRWAVEQSGAAAFVDALPQGLDSRLEERGANLSGGQRQLLGIARVLAFDPAVLVLDEATSSVDTITERLLQQALRTLLAGRTALIIAHRLSTILDADRIVVLAQGEIREQGRHEELLAQGGLYARLHALQFAGAEERERTPLSL